MARSYTETIENRNYGFHTDGEQWLLHRIGPTRPDVVFDVGADIGQWTAEVLAIMPAARVHAFEIVPATADRFHRRFAADPAVTLVRTGLYDEDILGPDLIAVPRIGATSSPASPAAAEGGVRPTGSNVRGRQGRTIMSRSRSAAP